MPTPPTMEAKLQELRRRRLEAERGGGEEKLEAHRQLGKLTARERIGALADAASFQETGQFAQHRATLFGMAGKEMAADGVITGTASVGGRVVHLASQDATVAGGSAGEVHCLKVAEIMQQSLKAGSPFVFINDSGGARVQEGVDSLSGYGKIFRANVMLSGVVPQIALICGPCAGGAAYSPALADFVIQTRKAQMFITGPQVIKQTTGEEVTAEQLGGASVHMARSGVVHFIADDDAGAIAICKRLLSFLPAHFREDPPRLGGADDTSANFGLEQAVPADGRRTYDVRSVVTQIVDGGDFLEVHAGFAGNMVVGLGRICGRTVGVVANQPRVQAGVLDIAASGKASRFINFCDAFHIPLLTLVDVPGFLPGVTQEHQGIIRHGAKLLYAYAAATTPKITVVLRKAYGGAYLAMCGKDLGADRVFAWPTAEIAVMGAEGAAQIVFRKEIQQAEDSVEKRREMIEKYREAFSNPFVAASRRLVDDVIEPAWTRRHIARALDALQSAPELRVPKKRGLPPM